MEALQWFAPRRLIRILVLVCLGLGAIFVEAAPLGLSADAYPSPDLLFCIVAFWSTRRPYVTVLPAIFILGLTRDLITDAPVGAGLLTLVFASEFLKALSNGLARRSFVTEYLLIALVSGVMTLAQWGIVLVLLAHPPYLSDLIYQWAATMGAYLCIVTVLRWIFRMRWPKPVLA